jgi:pyruvate/2-oxoglutarate/acetoin dehydrogenase E1 component
MRELTYNEAAVEAVAEEMRRDPKIFYMSTDPIAPLLNEFGAERVRATPITEAALTGMAIGAAGCGFRPIVDWRQVTFCFVAMDQIVNQAAKIHYMFGGQITFPILYRAAVGGGGQVAAQHSQSPYSMFMNVAGLKMFLPSTPYDIKGLLKTAIRDNNPVISF